MDASTRLVTLDMPHPDVVLEEVFHVPPAAFFPEVPRPETIGALAAVAGMDVRDVIKRLEALHIMSTDIEITPEELRDALASADVPIMVDVREEWEWDIAHIAGSILLGKVHFPDLVLRLKDAKLVVTVCHLGMRSYSAAMYLRQQGICEARSLTGGVEAWSRAIEPAMARY